ncbi:MAG TPA: penicillin-binding protein 1C, partial [Dokdonella sp.]
MSATPEPPPASVREVDVCWPLGQAWDPARADLCHQKRTAWVLDGVIPPTLAERDATSWSAGLLRVRVDAATGERLSADCPRKRVREIDVARWPALAYPWLSRDLRRRASVPPLAPGCAEDGLEAGLPLRIDGIGADAAIARAPNSGTPATLHLRALGTTGDVQWLVNGRLAGSTRGGGAFEHAFAQTGPQTITALADSGAWAQLHVRVLR